MGWNGAFAALGVTIASRGQLLAMGATGAGLTAAVRGNHLLRVRRDHYALPGTPDVVLRAVRVGGRLGCTSALQAAGIFAVDTQFPHISLPHNRSRLRSPANRFVPLAPENRDGIELHWNPLLRPDAGSEISVGIVDALTQSLWCQHPWHALASIDNALHLGRIGASDVDDIFRAAPDRAGYLQRLVDSRAESGQETVLRMILNRARLEFRPQVSIRGVGRVDFLVENRLVVEADSRLAHDGWDLHKRDRNRDLDLARRGLMSLRPVYERIMFAPDDVESAIVTLLAAQRPRRRPPRA
ncbi:MAG: hypothetical protein JWR53_32 [Glaciihabitans sp.]|nr:hypothetical protein [Glaciihabitans sp.]